jgi:hypothetical protein
MDTNAFSGLSISGEQQVPQLAPGIDAATYDAEIQRRISERKRVAPESVQTEDLEKLLGVCILL